MNKRIKLTEEEKIARKEARKAAREEFKEYLKSHPRPYCYLKGKPIYWEDIELMRSSKGYLNFRKKVLTSMYSEIKKNLEESNRGYSRLLSHIQNTDDDFAIIGSNDKDTSESHFPELQRLVDKLCIKSRNTEP